MAVRCALIGLAATAWSGAVRAQSQAPAAGSTELAPVTVSGKREALDEAPPPYSGGQVGSGARMGVLGNTPVLDTPFSVTSYTSESVRNEQARSVADLMSLDPSVRMGSARSNINEDLTIRGFPVSSSDYSFNGMFGLTPFWRAPLEAAERVEVFKGPASMLFGMPPSGNIGGTINLVPKRADSAPLTRFTGSYLSDSIFGAHLDVGRRFGPDNAFGVRINAMHRQGDTVIKSQSTKETLGSVGLDFRQSRVRASADLIWQQQEVQNVVRQFQVSPALTAVPRVPENSLSYPGMGWTHARDGMALLKGEFDVTDNVTLFAGYGSRHNNWDAVAANPVILNTAGDYSYFGGWQRQFVKTSSLEAGARLQARTGPVRHNATLSYSSVDQKYDLGFYTGFPGGASNLYSGQLFPTPSIDGIDNPLRPYLYTKLNSLALADTLSFLDDSLQLTLGLRHQQIDAQNYSFVTGAASGPRYDQGATTPVAALVYKPRRDVSVYASFAEGLTRGDTAPISAAIGNPGEMLAPYKTKQKEIGTKVDFGRFMTTLSLFEITKPSAAISGAVFAVNGEQRNRGLEANVFGEVTRGIRLLGGLAYTDGKIAESATPALVGRRAIGVPRLQVNLGTEWDTPFLSGLTLTGRVVHTASSYLDSANTLEVPSWTRLDVGARYRTRLGGRPVTFRLSVENVTDKDYYGVATAGYLHLGTPRTVMLSAAVDL